MQFQSNFDPLEMSLRLPFMESVEERPDSSSAKYATQNSAADITKTPQPPMTLYAHVPPGTAHDNAGDANSWLQPFGRSVT